MRRPRPEGHGDIKRGRTRSGGVRSRYRRRAGGTASSDEPPRRSRASASPSRSRRIQRPRPAAARAVKPRAGTAGGLAAAAVAPSGPERLLKCRGSRERQRSGDRDRTRRGVRPARVPADPGRPRVQRHRRGSGSGDHKHRPQGDAHPQAATSTSDAVSNDGRRASDLLRGRLARAGGREQLRDRVGTLGDHAARRSCRARIATAGSSLNALRPRERSAWTVPMRQPSAVAISSSERSCTYRSASASR